MGRSIDSFKLAGIQLTGVYYNEYDDTLIGYFDCSIEYLKSKINLDDYKNENIVCGDIRLEIDAIDTNGIYDVCISPVVSDEDGNESSIDWNYFSIEELILNKLIREMNFVFDEGGAIVIRD